MGDIRKVFRSSWILHTSVQLNVSTNTNMQWKDSLKSLPCREYLSLFYELMKLVVLAKVTLKFATQSSSKLFFKSWSYEFVFGNFSRKHITTSFRILLKFYPNNSQKRRRGSVATNFSRRKDLFLIFLSQSGPNLDLTLQPQNNNQRVKEQNCFSDR